MTGKTELVSTDMTYKEWYSKYVAKDGEKVYNQSMDKLDSLVSSGSIIEASENGED